MEMYVASIAHVDLSLTNILDITYRWLEDERGMSYFQLSTSTQANTSLVGAQRQAVRRASCAATPRTSTDILD